MQPTELNDTELNHQDRKLAPRRTANRLIAAVLLVAVGFSAVCAAFLVDARRTAWNTARDATASLVAALELDILLNSACANASQSCASPAASSRGV